MVLVVFMMKFELLVRSEVEEIFLHDTPGRSILSPDRYLVQVCIQLRLVDVWIYGCYA